MRSLFTCLLALPNPPDNLLKAKKKYFIIFYGMGVQIELSEASLLKTLKQGDSELKTFQNLSKHSKNFVYGE